MLNEMSLETCLPTQTLAHAYPHTCTQTRIILPFHVHTQTLSPLTTHVRTHTNTYTHTLARAHAYTHTQKYRHVFVYLICISPAKPDF